MYGSKEFVHAAKYASGGGYAPLLGRGMPKGSPIVRGVDPGVLAKTQMPWDISILSPLLGEYVPESEILQYEDKIYRDGDKYYKLKIAAADSNSQQELIVDLKESEYPNIVQTILNTITSAGYAVEKYPSSASEYVIPFNIYYSAFTIYWEEVGPAITSSTAILKPANRQLYDAPYKMFCMPI